MLFVPKGVSRPLGDYFYNDEPDVDSLFIEPVHIKRVTKEVYAGQAKRAKRESSTGFFMRPYESYLAVKDTVDDTYGEGTFDGDRLANELHTYLRTIASDGETAFELADGNVLVGPDTMSVKRMLTLLNGIILKYYIRKDNGEPIWFETGYESSFDELILHIFNNPYINESGLKKVTSVLRQSAFCLTEKGMHPKWQNPVKVLIGGLVKTGIHQIEHNDQAYYDVVHEAIDDELKSIKDSAGIAVSKLWEDTLKWDFTPNTMRRVISLQAAIRVTGFSRTNRPVAHRSQWDIDMTKIAPVIGPVDQYDHIPAAVRLESLVFETVMNQVQGIRLKVREGKRHKRLKPGIIDFDTLVSNTFGLMTTKSAGGKKVRVAISVRVTRVNRNFLSSLNKGHFTRLKPNAKFGWIRLTMTSKMAVALTAPNSIFDIQEFEKALDKSFTIIDGEKFYPNAGKAGTRSVPGSRPERMVAMRPIFLYIWESIFTNLLAREHFADDTYTVGSETGAVIMDHAFSAAITSSSEILAIAKDYKAFDAHNRSQNTAYPVRDGFIRAFRKLNIDKEPYGPFPSLSVLIHRLMVDKNGSPFQLEDGTFVIVDGLQSGVNWTLNYNNVVNKAITDEMWHRINLDPLLKASIVKRQDKLQGDDSLSSASITVKKMSDLPNVYKRLVDVMVRVSHESGQELNGLKTVTRLFYSEYLKKIFIYGEYIGAPTQLLSAENFSTEPPIVRMRSYVANMSLMAERGMDHQVLLNHVKNVWNHSRIMRGLTFQDGKTYETKLVLPFGLLYTPGAIGIMPDTFTMANKDDAISFVAQLMEREGNDNYIKMIEYCSKVASVKLDSFSRIMGKSVRRGNSIYRSNLDDKDPTYRRWGDDFKTFVRRNVMIGKKQLGAYNSAQQMQNIGLKPNPIAMDYRFFAENTLETTVSSIPNIRNIFKLTRQIWTTAYIKAEKEGKSTFQKNFSWLSFYNVSRGDEILMKDGLCGLSSWCPILRKLVNLFGVARVRKSRWGGDIIVRKWAADPTAPRYTEQQIADAITDPQTIPEDHRTNDALFHFAVIAGVNSDVARSFADEFSGKINDLMINVQRSRSLGDAIFSNIDVDADVALNVQVDNRPLITTDNFPGPLMRVLGMVGFQYAILEYFRSGKMFHYHISARQGFYEAYRSTFHTRYTHVERRKDREWERANDYLFGKRSNR
jgi:hypothetical protein